MVSSRKKLQTGISPDYQVDIEELVKSAGLNVTPDGKILLEDVADLPPETLLDIMSRIIGAMEYIESKRALVLSVVKQKAVDLSALEAQKRLNFLEKKQFARGSRTDAENAVSQDEEVRELRKKIAKYEAYAQYLKSMYDLLSMAHYTAKTALNVTKSRETMDYGP